MKQMKYALMIAAAALLVAGCNQERKVESERMEGRETTARRGSTGSGQPTGSDMPPAGGTGAGDKGTRSDGPKR